MAKRNRHQLEKEITLLEDKLVEIDRQANELEEEITKLEWELNKLRKPKKKPIKNVYGQTEDYHEPSDWDIELKRIITSNNKLAKKSKKHNGKKDSHTNDA